MLRDTGLVPVLRAIESHDGSTPLSRLEGLAPDTLRHAARRFYALLATFLVASAPRVQAPRLRSRVQRDTARVLAAAYESLVAAVDDPRNEYPREHDGRFLPQSTADVRTALDLE